MKKNGNEKSGGVVDKILGFISGDKTSPFAVPIISILLSLIVASLLLAALGKSPVQGFSSFLQGCGLLPKPSYASGKGMITDFFSFLGILAPMILASLGIVMGLRANMFNIGVSGQMLSAGFLATVIIGYSGLDAVIAKPLVIVIGMVVGCLLGSFVGLLKYKFNIHEVVATIIIDYIINYIVGFFINSKFADPFTRASRACSDAARLTVNNVDLGGYKISFPFGIIVAIIAVILIKIFLDKTVAGFELKNVGLNKDCARYAGMNVNKNIMISMGMSGLLAGLAGVTYYLGYYNNIYPNTLSGMGYDAIAVALLGNSNPVGAVFGAFLITILQAGTIYMNSTIGVSKEISSVITGIILLFSACGGFLVYLSKKQLIKRQESHKEAKEEK